MVYDAISNIHLHCDQHPGFKAAQSFLEHVDFDTLKEGTYEIKGKEIFAIVETCYGKGKQAAKLEAHRKYIDIQLCLCGNDLIGTRSVQECHDVLVDYDEVKDIVFYEDPIDEWITIDDKYCAIFFPEDAHAPLAGTGLTQKMVIKIAV